ncbi:MAG: hypothetical protein AAFV98_05775 [Chloroflexota bacterium]
MPYKLPRVPKENFIRGAIKQNFRTYIWEFDFQKVSRGQSYIGVPTPDNLIEVIEEIITENEFDFRFGDIKELKKIVTHLKAFTAPAFKLGQEKALGLWKTASRSRRKEYVEYKPHDFQASAFNHAQEQITQENLRETEKSWFVEGFCRQWASEVFDQMVRDILIEHIKSDSYKNIIPDAEFTNATGFVYLALLSAVNNCADMLIIKDNHFQWYTDNALTGQFLGDGTSTPDHKYQEVFRTIVKYDKMVERLTSTTTREDNILYVILYAG